MPMASCQAGGEHIGSATSLMVDRIRAMENHTYVHASKGDVLHPFVLLGIKQLNFNFIQVCRCRLVAINAFIMYVVQSVLP